MTIAMTEEQYDQLLMLVDSNVVPGSASEDDLKELRRSIDSANGITRYFLCVSYQAVPTNSAVTTAQVSAGYPPHVQHRLVLRRKPTRADVDALLQGVATTAELVMVTPDPDGIAGWSLLEDYDFSVGVPG